MNWKDAVSTGSADRRTVLAAGIAGIAGAALLALPGTGALAAAKPRKPTYVYVSSNASFFSGGQANPDAIGIYAYQFDPKTGGLTPVQQIRGPSPSWMELDPSRRFLYVCYSLRGKVKLREGLVEAYAIDPQTGMLTLLNKIALDSGPAELAIAPDTRHLVIANYYYGDYVVLPIGPDGRLGPISGSLKDTGKGPQPRQDSPHPHAVAFHPNGRFIGAADLGTDKVQTLRLVGDGLELVSEASVPAGMGPRHVAFSRNGKTLYAIGELDGKILAFDYDPATGKIGDNLQTVTTAPAGYTGGQSGAEVVVHPSGKFLYGSNRASQVIAGYRIDGSTGKLSSIGFATEGVDVPTSFTIDPSGKWLYVPSNRGNKIIQFIIDPQSGGLKPTGQTTSLAAPNVMVFRTPD